MFRIETYLKQIINEALQRLSFPQVEYSFDKPKLEKHGDISINAAMQLAAPLKMPPRKIAEQIAENLQPDSRWIGRIDIAGPGFINFFYTPALLQQVVREIISEGEQFGRQQSGQGKMAQVEFVSANPTGPLTIGHGRQAVLGDTVANFLQWQGFTVVREYYFNNAGRQMRVLGESVKTRYRQLCGQQVEFSEEYYQGEYIRDIARQLYDEHGNDLLNEPAEGLFKDTAERVIFEDIRKTLKRLSIEFDDYFNEKDLYESGRIEQLIRRLKEKDLAYEEDGALWFRSTRFGLEQDRVIVKSSGEPTYRLPDIAYHATKFERGFDLIVDIFGADHIATYPDVLAGVQALGLDPAQIKILIHQFVTLYRGQEKVKMSTRKANFVTLDELIDEAGVDVTRWFFLMRSMDSHLNFDLLLAKTQSDENPVYYNQYAHARICSILRTAASEGVNTDPVSELEPLSEPSEQQLMKKLQEFPGVVERCAGDFTPHLLPQYLSSLSTSFHKFYTECRVLGEDTSLTRARLTLCLAVKTVLANGFAILGVSAPESM
ncbi:MAG: arginine--tRNA ligase [Calditrichia bacterium]